MSELPVTGNHIKSIRMVLDELKAEMAPMYAKQYLPRILSSQLSVDKVDDMSAAVCRAAVCRLVFFVDDDFARMWLADRVTSLCQRIAIGVLNRPKVVVRFESMKAG